MDENLIQKIDQMIDACREEMASDLVKLVNIKSVESEAQGGAPFGIGPRMVLDAVMKMGQEEGFYCKDYDVGIVSLALKDGIPDLGIWMHGDVVPEGDGWKFDPYNAVEYKGRIIGRGASDNKGSIAVMLTLFKIFKSLKIKLRYNPAMYIGSNEETGMADMVGIPENSMAKGFLNVCTPPKISLVPDGGKFPVGYGGKGGIMLTLKSKTPLNAFSIEAGKNEAPGEAVATFDNSVDVPENLSGCTIVKGEKTKIVARSIPRHGSEPDPKGNMITMLTKALIVAQIVSDDELDIMEFFNKVSLDITGKMFNINVENETMGPLTVFAYGIDCEDNYPEIKLNIRYPLGITYEEIIENISQVSEKKRFSISKAVRGVDPYMLNPGWEVIQKLSKVANSVTGDNELPFIMSGGTYAHRLPNALVYGIDGCRPPEDFCDGRGRAHGVDEAVSLDYLQRAMKIYARALLTLNEMDW